MQMFFAILILVPTVGVLVIGALMIIWILALDLVGGVDGIVVGLQHRLHRSAHTTDTRWGNAALHH
jgi:hypothetical protein